MRKLTLLKTCFSLVIVAAVAIPCVASAAVLPGVPAGDSLLFALHAKEGTLSRNAESDKFPYRITLTGVDPGVTWFSDRPHRDAGRVSTRIFSTAWGRLGFGKNPPNGALLVDGAPTARDAMAFELKLRSYSSKTRRASFEARSLHGLGNGLSHLNRRLDRYRTMRFKSSSLFIDNVSSTSGCSFGQPQLIATGESWARSVTDMMPANGMLLPTSNFPVLYSIYGTTFGGNGETNFSIPKMLAPAGTTWYLCTQGIYPSAEGISEACSLGEVDYWALPSETLESMDDSNWVRADGRSLSVAEYPQYAAAYAGGQATFQVPNVSAPPGFVSLTCVAVPGVQAPSIGQVDLFPAAPTTYSSSWLPADGRQISIQSNPLLYAALGSPGSTDGTFALPNLTSPATGVSYYIAVQGSWEYD